MDLVDPSIYIYNNGLDGFLEVQNRRNAAKQFVHKHFCLAHQCDMCFTNGPI